MEVREVEPVEIEVHEVEPAEVVKPAIVEPATLKSPGQVLYVKRKMPRGHASLAGMPQEVVTKSLAIPI
jgi:hypothetical protein